MNTEEMTSAHPLDLDLYHLNSELAGLIEYRQERLADTTDPPTAEEIEAIDAEIRRYEIATPQKTSGTVAVLRSWRAKRANAKAEIERLRKIAAHLEAMETQLEGYLADILASLPPPKKGCKKLVGVDGSQIMLRGNGGPAPLKVQEDVLPDEYRDVTVNMPLISWRIIQSSCQDALPLTPPKEQVEIANGRIREALESGQAVPGAWLDERGSHVEIR